MDMAVDRRGFFSGGAILMAAGRSWAADPWPAKPVRWVVPYPAGAFTDAAARVIGKRRAKFSTFTPVAIAAIGTSSLTLPLLSRSITIAMTRHDEARDLKRFDRADTANLDATYSHVVAFARRAVLDADPALPVELRVVVEVLQHAATARPERGASRRSSRGRRRFDLREPRPRVRRVSRDVLDDGRDPFVGQRAGHVQARAVARRGHTRPVVVEIHAGDAHLLAWLHVA